MADQWRKGARTALIAVFLISAGLLAIGPTHYRVNFDAVLDIWGDVLRDLDAVVRTVRISTEREVELGNDIHRRMHFRWSSNAVSPKMVRYVSDVGDRVAAEARRKDIPYTFHVVRNGAPNAWAIPGGHVYITEKMLGIVKSEAELAAILGHEISHIDLYHCVHRVQDAVMLEQMGLDVIAFLVSLAEGFVSVGFSEVQETEADRTGFLLAARAGYNPLGGFATFESFHDIIGDGTASEIVSGGPEREIFRSLRRALEDYYGTHPEPLERLDALRFVLTNNERAFQGKTFYTGETNHADHVSQTRDAREDERRVFSTNSLDYLSMRLKLAMLLQRRQEAAQFMRRLEERFPGNERTLRLRFLLARGA